MSTYTCTCSLGRMAFSLTILHTMYMYVLLLYYDNTMVTFYYVLLHDPYVHIYIQCTYASDLLQCVLLQVWFWMGGQNQDDWQIVSVSLYFFTNLTTALLLTVNPSSLNSLRIEVDLYPNPEKKTRFFAACNYCKPSCFLPN